MPMRSAAAKAQRHSGITTPTHPSSDVREWVGIARLAGSPGNVRGARRCQRTGNTQQEVRHAEGGRGVGSPGQVLGASMRSHADPGPRTIADK
eukprot:NODE_3487_length_438_cov_4.316195_g3055_i0.p1 GENE.NODE_3487_length_438_cov_4.316195_g3055_i0~~NODE_3487_length_438_cov_4.316195_g3055_i0.p1  ORF type:complete len:93 (-),score=1.74 NODE_3487_length_438_cov_4.316195_g3055_i0:84-362(-)